MFLFKRGSSKGPGGCHESFGFWIPKNRGLKVPEIPEFKGAENVDFRVCVLNAIKSVFVVLTFT